MQRRGISTLLAAAVAVALLTGAIGVLATTAPTPGDAQRATSGGGATGDSRPVNASLEPSSDVAHVHADGVTGKDVSVGVVDVTGFDTDASVLEGRVAAARSFSPGESVANGGYDAHGTAAASLVARTAPDADLYLASFDTADGYERAVTWLRERVDVVVAPVSFYGAAGDGSSRPARVANETTDSGTLFVAPVGNLAEGHWAGRYDDVRDGKLAFSGGTRNYLRGNDSRAVVWLSWDRTRADEDYTAELYWTNGTATRLVARSRPYPGDGVPNERISARLEGGTYFVVVRGPGRATNASLELVSPTHALQYRQRAGSIAAPATAENVVAVGAYDRRSHSPEPFTSRGPTADGRRGLDVLAPDRLRVADRPEGFVGSSAAAPYVAGVAALVLEADPDRSPAELEALLHRSATDMGPTGPDPRTGYGSLSPIRAVALAGNESG